MVIKLFIDAAKCSKSISAVVKGTTNWKQTIYLVDTGHLILTTVVFGIGWISGLPFTLEGSLTSFK